MQRTGLALGWSAACAALLAGADARAQTTAKWNRDTTLPGISAPGCALGLAVGPNNVPWVLGCDTNSAGNHSVWFLKSTVQGYSTTYQWTQFHPGSAAEFLSNDTTGAAWITTSAGNVYVALTTNGQGALTYGPYPWAVLINNNWPGGDAFYCVSNNNGGIAGVSRSGIGGCATETSVIDTPSQYWNDPPDWQIWTVGCGNSQANREVWSYTVNTTNPQWFAPQSGQATAQKLAFFTLNEGSGNYSYSTWTLSFFNNNQQTALWRYDSEHNTFDPMPNIDSVGAWSLTDHFAVGFGGVSMWNDLTQSWIANYAPAVVSNNGAQVFITRIANANQSVYGQGSQLWGIDTSGGIWYATIPQNPP